MALKSYGTRQMTLLINNNKYSCRFQVSEVHKSILSADFLCANDLLINLSNKRLIPLNSLTIVRASSKKSQLPPCATLHKPQTQQMSLKSSSRAGLS